MSNNFFKIRNGVNVGVLTADPSNPADGDIYYSSTLNQFRSYQNGSWVNLGSGSGGGGSKNYLSQYVASTSGGATNSGNGNFELGSTTGWSLGTIGTLTNGLPTGSPTFGSGASGNLSISAISSGQLAGSYSLSYASSTATVQGNMLSSDAFYIDTEDQAKVLTWKFYYKAETNPTNANWSGTSSNSFGVAVYDVTNSAWLGTTATFGMTQNSGVGYATGTVQTATTTAQLRLVVYNVNATTGAITLYFDDFTFGPQTAPIGATITDWQSYAPTGTWTTNTTYTGKWKRVGDTGFYDVTIALSGAPASGNLGINLPSGQTIDTTKMTNSTGAIPELGQWGSTNSSVFQTGIVYYGSTTSVGIAFISSVSTGQITTLTPTVPVTWASGNVINARWSAPIVGWSSNVQMSSDTDTRVVAFRATATTGSTVGTSLTTIPFSGISVDTHGAWSTNTYTVPVAGEYQVLCKLTTASVNLSTSQFIQMAVLQNGSQVSNVQANGNGASNATLAEINDILICKAGDTIQIQLLSNIATTINASGTYSTLAISRLSGPSVIAATESVNGLYTDTSGASISSSFTKFTYGTKIRDTHNAYNGGILTIPVSGMYQFQASLSSTNFTLTTSQAFQVNIVRNGTNISVDYTYGTGSASSSYIAEPSIAYPCLAGDQIEIEAFSTVSTTAATSVGFNNFSWARVGN